MRNLKIIIPIVVIVLIALMFNACTVFGDNDKVGSEKNHTEYNSVNLEVESTTEKVTEKTTEKATKTNTEKVTEAAAVTNNNSAGASSVEDSMEYNGAEALKIWREFISSQKYFDYVENQNISDLEYAIHDINADTIAELLIQSKAEPSFITTWTFRIYNKKIILVDETYGYGSFRFESKKNLIFSSPETRPFEGCSYSPFYSLIGQKLVFSYQVGIDGDNYIFHDSKGTKIITENEYNSYFDNLISFQWKKLS